jgi:hypothetical protein
MTLQRKWVDAIFTKLTVRYGKAFLNRWEGVDIELVKADWAHELGDFNDSPDAIKYALEYMDPAKPPTAAMFKELARRAPAKEMPVLEAPEANPELVAKVMSEINTVAKPNGRDPKDWARRIVARHEAGEKIYSYNLRLARAALETVKA